MKIFGTILLLAALGFLMPPSLAYTQEASTPSLGDLARQLRAQREKSSHPAKLYTNDNLPTRTAIEGSTSKESAPAKLEAASTSETAGEKEPHNEAYYRKHMSDLQSKLSMHQRELNVLQQKLSQGQMVYYPDPNKTLQQESTPSFQSDVNKLRQDIQDKQAEIVADQKAIDDLRDQLRREGGDPGWLR